MSKNSQNSAQKSRVLTTSAIRIVLKCVVICAIIGAIAGLGVMLASNLGLTASAAPEAVVARRASNVSEVAHEPAQEIDLSGVTFKFETTVYDGTAKTAKITGEETLPEGVTVSYRNNVHTNAGTYTAIAIFSGKGYRTAYLEAEMVIEKAHLVGATFESKTFNYTGSPFTIELTLPNGKMPEGLSIEYVGNVATDLGTFNATAIVYGDNYYTDHFEATITILPSDIKGITLDDATFSYDETEHKLNYNGTLPTEVTPTWTENGRTEVGSHTVTLTLSGYGYNDLILTADITVEKGDLLKVYGITFDDKKVEYDAADHNLELLGRLDGVTVKYTYNGETKDTLPTFKKAGTYEIKVSLSKDSFNDAEITSTLVIEKADITGTINLSNTTHTYDGDSVGLTEGTHGNFFQDETTVTYTHNGVSQAKPFTFTEAGEYDITITVEGDNVKTYTITRTVTIKKATIDNVSFYDADYTYRDSAKRTVKVDINGELPEGVYVEYSCNGTTQTDPITYTAAGKYDVTATIKGNPNYEELVLTATLTVAKADFGYYVDVDRNQKFTNNGNSYLPGYKFYEDAPAEVDAGDVKFYLNGELLTSGLSQPGEYNIVMVVESENYYYEEEITLTIGYNAIVILIGLAAGALAGLVLGIIISIVGSGRDRVSQRHFAVPREGIAKVRGGILCESRAKSKNTKHNGRLYLTSQTLEFYAEDYRTATNNFLIDLREIRNVEAVAHNKLVVCANRQYYTFTVPAGRADEWRYQIEKA